MLLLEFNELLSAKFVALVSKAQVCMHLLLHFTFFGDLVHENQSRIIDHVPTRTVSMTPDVVTSAVEKDLERKY